MVTVVIILILNLETEPISLFSFPAPVCSTPSYVIWWRDHGPLELSYTHSGVLTSHKWW